MISASFPQMPTKPLFSFQLRRCVLQRFFIRKVSVALRGFNGTEQGIRGNLDKISPLYAWHLVIHDEVQELGIRCFSCSWCSFQLRDTTTQPCMPCHGARLRSSASTDYFDLTSRISVRHRPSVCGSFDRSALELRAQRSSSPFCTSARPSTIRYDGEDGGRCGGSV